jgi:gas vesicle protein
MDLTVAKQKKRSGSGFIWGLMIGIAVGATVAWVLTPQPGELAATPAGTGGAASDKTGADDQPTIADLAMAAVDRVRSRYAEAVTLGREAYMQGQTEVMQRFNQARAES